MQELATTLIDLQNYCRGMLEKSQQDALIKRLIDIKQRLIDANQPAAALALADMVKSVTSGKLKAFPVVSAKEEVRALVESMTPGETRTINYERLAKYHRVEYNTIKMYFQQLTYAGVITRKVNGRHKYDITRLRGTQNDTI